MVRVKTGGDEYGNAGNGRFDEDDDGRGKLSAVENLQHTMSEKQE